MINPSYGSYVHQLSYLWGTTLYVFLYCKFFFEWVTTLVILVILLDAEALAPAFSENMAPTVTAIYSL